MLPGWGDDAIMLCDMARLRIAIEAARVQSEADWRRRYRIGGFKVDEPMPEPEDDEAFNDQMRGTIEMFRTSKM